MADDLENKGIRIPLVVDGALFLSGVIAMTTVWWQVGDLQKDIDEIKKSQVTEARVVSIEKDVKSLLEKQTELTTAIKEYIREQRQRDYDEDRRRHL